MQEQIKITMPEVSASASQMRALNLALDEVLNSITNIMNEINGVWDSSGSREIAARFKNFAARFTKESEIIEKVADGLNNKEIAAALYLSEGTVRNYLSTILEKLNLRDRTQLAIFYYRHLV